MFDEELWFVLSRVGTFEVAELAAAARTGKEPVRHIKCASNLNYRRYRRFEGEALCSTQLGRKRGFHASLADPTCPACLEVARKLTELPPGQAEITEHGHQQLSFFQ